MSAPTPGTVPPRPALGPHAIPFVVVGALLLGALVQWLTRGPWPLVVAAPALLWALWPEDGHRATEAETLRLWETDGEREQWYAPEAR